MTTRLFRLKQTQHKDDFPPPMKKQAISGDKDSWLHNMFLHFVHGQEMEKQDENDSFIEHSIKKCHDFTISLYKS